MKLGMVYRKPRGLSTAVVTASLDTSHPSTISCDTEAVGTHFSCMMGENNASRGLIEAEFYYSTYYVIDLVSRSVPK